MRTWKEGKFTKCVHIKSEKTAYKYLEVCGPAPVPPITKSIKVVNHCRITLKPCLNFCSRVCYKWVNNDFLDLINL